jgi:hypothetical protein
MTRINCFSIYLLSTSLQISFAQTSIELKYKLVPNQTIVYKLNDQPLNKDSVIFKTSFFEAIAKDTTFPPIQKKDDSIDFIGNANKERLDCKKEYFALTRKAGNRIILQNIIIDSSCKTFSMNPSYIFEMDNTGTNLYFFYGGASEEITDHLFRLPKGKISKGDEIPIQSSFISLSGLLRCDSMHKRSNMYVDNIEITNDDTLVTLKYDCEEFFRGVVTISNLEMKIKYYGKAVFSVKNGYWMSYDCTKETDSNGLLEIKLKQKQQLELIQIIPKEIEERIKKN